jgi:hypothetical protein
MSPTKANRDDADTKGSDSTGSDSNPSDGDGADGTDTDRDEVVAAAAVSDDAAGDENSEPGADAELSEQDELDLRRLDVALVTLGDEALRRGLAGINEKQRQELATHLNLPRATVHLGDGLAPLVRRKLRGLSVDRQHAIATALTQRANDATVELLGDRSEDPSRADLDEVLPSVIDEYGIELVRLMIASYAISEAPVREVMRELLETDERFALADTVPDEEGGGSDDLPSFGLVPRATARVAATDPERAELRERRKAAKAERRAAASRARAARAAAQASRREALHASKRPPAAR